MTARLNSLTGLLAVILVAGCGAPFEASGSGAGGDDAGGSTNAAMKPESVAGRSGSAGASPASITDGGANSASGSGSGSGGESTGSAGATGHENACTKEMTFDHPTCMANDWPTYYGAGCTAPCRPTIDGYWCCPG